MKTDVEDFLKKYKKNFIIKDDKNVLIKIDNLSDKDLDIFLETLYAYKKIPDFHQMFDKFFEKRKKFLGLF